MDYLFYGFIAFFGNGLYYNKETNDDIGRLLILFMPVFTLFIIGFINDKTMNSWYYREMGSRNKKTVN